MQVGIGDPQRTFLGRREQGAKRIEHCRFANVVGADQHIRPGLNLTVRELILRNPSIVSSDSACSNTLHCGLLIQPRPHSANCQELLLHGNAQSSVYVTPEIEEND
jgi:hypothetical protein